MVVLVAVLELEACNDCKARLVSESVAGTAVETAGMHDGLS